MNVSLTPELEALIKEKVASGRYSTASEVVRDALRALELRDKTNAEKLAELRAEIQKGIDSGPGIPADKVFAELRALIEKKKAERDGESRAKAAG